VYALPLICISLQDELLMPLEGGEGPLGLIICPSRELANQTVEVITQYTEALHAVRVLVAGVFVWAVRELIVLMSVHIGSPRSMCFDGCSESYNVPIT
jgi:hypothetical protein